MLLSLASPMSATLWTHQYPAKYINRKCLDNAEVKRHCIRKACIVNILLTILTHISNYYHISY